MSGPDTSPVLAVRDVVAGYGQGVVLQGLTLHIAAQKTMCIIGPNGAGKSSALKAIFGLLTIHKGEILMQCGSQSQPMRIDGWSPSRVVASGVAMVPQVKNVFAGLTVWENLAVVRHLCGNGSAFNQGIERVHALFPQLAEHWHQPAGTLSGGQRQMVAIGRALLPSPKLLLLDEPTAGLSPLMAQKTFAMIDTLRQERCMTIVMVEQNAKAALAVSDCGAVMAGGRVRHTGAASEILSDAGMGSYFMRGESHKQEEPSS